MTWLTEATVAMRLIDAYAVDAGRGVASGQFLLAVQSDESGRATAVRSAVAGHDARSAIVAHHGIAGVEAFLAKLALVTCK